MPVKLFLKMLKQLIVLSGLPATGKSTLARFLAQELKIPLFSKDRYEALLMRQGLTDGHSIYSYHLLLDSADYHLELGLSVVLDAVFPLAGFRQTLHEIVTRQTAQLKILHTYCSNENLHRQRLESRPVTLPWGAVTWDDVNYLRSVYQAWSADEALFLDAIQPLAENQARALDYLG